jgi:hypothetical protein
MQNGGYHNFNEESQLLLLLDGVIISIENLIELPDKFFLMLESHRHWVNTQKPIVFLFTITKI